MAERAHWKASLVYVHAGNTCHLQLEVDLMLTEIVSDLSSITGSRMLTVTQTERCSSSDSMVLSI